MSTPGPWYWQVNKHSIRLMTPKNGNCVVMDFVRQGMQGAQPRFSDRGDRPLGGIMHPASEIDLDKNPDARLIAMSPRLREKLIKISGYLSAAWGDADFELPDGIQECFDTLDDLDKECPGWNTI